MTDRSDGMPGLRHRLVHIADDAGRRDEDTWGIAVEAPVAIVVNGVPWTVMLATPVDLEALAFGILLTERVIRNPSCITDISVDEYLDEFTVRVTADHHTIDHRALRSRSLMSNTACGLCGIESLAQLHRRREEWQAVVNVDDNAIRRAMASLPSHQPLNAATHSVHAAAWCGLDGRLQTVSEDIGRHNALDKLIGSLALSGRIDEAGFVLMSSRCSYELVYKTAVLNAQLLASISAPTTLALNWASQLGIPLATCTVKDASIEIVRVAALTATDQTQAEREVVHVGG